VVKLYEVGVGERVVGGCLCMAGGSWGGGRVGLLIALALPNHMPHPLALPPCLPHTIIRSSTPPAPST
jgi:hypothetical protein